MAEPGIPNRTAASLDDILITGELEHRPSRPPDHAAEHEALDELIRTLAEDPLTVLQRLCELVIRLCHADSAGVSTYEPDGEHGILRWQAVAGAFAPNLGGTMPRNISPCGTVMDRDAVLLFDQPARFFTDLDLATPHIHEALLAPWHIGRTPAGTVWAIQHGPEGRFDAEDVRLMQSLASFAAAAWQTVTALDEAAAGRVTLERQVEERTRALRVSEAKFRSFFSSTEEGFAICELLFDGVGNPIDFVVLEANPNFGRMLQTTDVVGKRGTELLTDSIPSWFEAYARVIDTGEPLHFANYLQPLESWFEGYVTRVGEPVNRQFAIVAQDVTERERRDANIAFLSDVSRDLGDLTNIDATMNALSEKIGARFSASLCVFAEISESTDTASINLGWNRPDMPSILGVYRISDFVGAEFVRACHANEMVVVRDVDTDPRVNAESLAQLNIASFVFVPLLRDGAWVFMVAVYDAVPRDWRDDEIALLQELTERIWSRLERARAEAALRASEEKYRTLFDSIDAGVHTTELIYDADGQVVDVWYRETNAALERLTGLRDIVGKRLSEIAPNFDSEMLSLLGQVAATGEPARFEARITDVDDSWFDVFVACIGGPGSATLVAVYTNITTRKRAEMALRESEDRQAFLLHLNDALRSLADPGAVQEAAMRLIAERHGALRALYFDVAPDGDQVTSTEGVDASPVPIPRQFRISDFGRWLVDAFAAGQTVAIENVDTDARLDASNRAAHQALFTRAAVAVPLVKGGRLVAALAVNHTDPYPWPAAELRLLEEVAERTWAATEQTRAEKALRESERRLHATYNHVGVGIQELDEQGRYLRMNEPFLQFSGYTPEDFAGRSIFDAIVDEHDRAATQEHYQQLVRGEIDEIAEERMRVTKDGRNVWVQTMTTAVRDDDQRFLYAVRAIHDVTKRRQAEDALRASEVRHAFLLKLSDVLRRIGSPQEIQTVAMRVLGEHLGANRVHSAEIDEARGTYTIRHTYSNGLPPVAGQGSPGNLSDFPTTADLAGHQQMVVVEDVNADARLSDAERTAYRAMGISAAVTVPLVKDGRWVLTLAVHQSTPRPWTPGDIGLVQETAERMWAAVERSQAEAALHQSEARLRMLFESIDEGFLEIEVIMSADGRVDDWRYISINPSFQRLTGMEDMTGRLASEFLPDLEPEWAEQLAQVVNTGVAIRIEMPVAQVGRWFDAYLAPIGGPGSRRIAAVYTDVTQRKRREINLAFLSEVSRDLANLTNIASTMDDLCARIGAHLDASLCAFSMIDEAAGTMTTAHSWERPGTPNFIGIFPIDDVHGDDFRRASRAGDTFVVRDALHDPRVEAAHMVAFQVGAFITVPIVQDGVWRFDLTLTDTAPRDWRDDEIALLQELATRIWAWLERARAEDALLASEEQYRTLFDSIDEGFCTIEVLFDEQGRAVDYRFLEVNPAFERQTGLADAVGKTARELVPDHEPIWFEIYARIAKNGVAMRFEQESAPIGRYYDVYAFRIGEPGDNRLAVLFNDIAARKQTEQALRESEASLQRRVDAATVELRTLSQRLLTVQEEERRRLALELHDDFGQVLTGLGLALGASPNAEQLEEARATVAGLTDRVRQRSIELRPAALDAYGLLPALRPLVDRYERQAGIHVELRHEGLDRRFPGPVEVAAYRIVQEALTNIARHAGTPSAAVQLFADDVALTVSIRDAGQGFDPDTAAAGSGLGGMRERAQLLGGTFTVDTVPGAGVTIIADLPLEAPDLEQSSPA